MKSINLSRSLLAAVAVLSLLAAPFVEAAQTVKQPEMVVSATKTKEQKDRVPSTVYLVGKEELEEKGIWNLTGALRSVPGLWVSSNGAFGGPAKITMRGSQNGQVRIMLDGVRLADPIEPSNAFNISLFNVEAVDQIEVVQGPQSTLFGSDAMAGVVNILSRRGQGDPSVWALAQGGTYSSFQGQLGAQGEVDKFNFFLSGSGVSTDGISAAKDQPENDPYRNFQFNTRMGYEFRPGTELYAIGYYHDAKADYDSFWSKPADTADWKESTAWTGILGFTHKVNHWWDHKIALSTGRSQRDYSEGSEYNSKLTSTEWQNNLRYQDQGVLTLGVDWEEEEGDFHSAVYGDRLETQRAHDLGFYLQAMATPLKGLLLTGGLRHDTFKEFGGHLTWRLAAAGQLAGTGAKFRATYGTGFKTPSLFQRYSQFGSRELGPAKSRGWDLGLDQDLWDKKAKLSLTYFQMNTDDLIVYDFGTSTYQNVGQARSAGLEFSFSWEICESLLLDGSYTYTDAEDKTTGNILRYVPRDKITLGLRWTPVKSIVTRLYAIRVGKRYANDANTDEVEAYTVVDLAASYEINKHFKLFCRVHNLFDEDYQEIKDYGTLGLSGFMGIKLTY